MSDIIFASLIFILQGAVFIFVVALLGIIFHSFFLNKNQVQSSEFEAFIFGFIALITIATALITLGKTSLTFLVIFPGIFLYFNRPHFKAKIKFLFIFSAWKKMFFWFIIGYTFQFACVFGNGEGFQFLFVDFPLYAMLSGELVSLKTETFFTIQKSLDLPLPKHIPYHFFELWTAGFWLKFFNNSSSYLTYIFGLIPFLFALQAFSVHFILKHFVPAKKNASLILVIAGILPFFTLSFPGITSPPFSENIFILQKGWAAFALIGPIIIWLKQRAYWKSGFALIFLTISNIVFIPFVFPIILVGLLLNWKTEFRNPWLITFCFLISYCVVFFVWTNRFSGSLLLLENSYIPTVSISNLIQNFNWGKAINRLQILITKSVFFLIPIAAYWLKLHFLDKKKLDWIPLSGLIYFCFMGSLLGSLLYFLPESWHFSSVSLLVSLSCIYCFTLGSIIQNKQWIWAVGPALFILISIPGNNMDKRYKGDLILKNELDKISRLLPEKNHLKGVFLEPIYEFDNHFHATNFWRPGNPISLFKRTWETVGNYPEKSQQIGVNYYCAPVFQFGEKNDGEFSLSNFMHHYELDFIITKKDNKTPIQLPMKISESIPYSEDGQINIYSNEESIN
ncbi:MAG: hypothetical protein ACI9YL_001476 [Luteibaculaceae bacterium]|jgi:hypothetical protein